MKQFKTPPPFLARNPRRGMTLVEVSIAVGIGSMVAIGLMSLSIMSAKADKSIFYEQFFAKQNKTAIESLNQEIRLANTYLTVSSADGGTKNKISFTQEDGSACVYELYPGADGNIATPWDNVLRLSKNSGTTWKTVAKWAAPADGYGGFGAFLSSNTTTTLTIKMRIGDPPSGAVDYRAHSGNGRQGVNLNITVSPRMSTS